MENTFPWAPDRSAQAVKVDAVKMAGPRGYLIVDRISQDVSFYRAATPSSSAPPKPPFATSRYIGFPAFLKPYAIDFLNPAPDADYY